jgi:hypothetical protein
MCDDAVRLATSPRSSDDQVEANPLPADRDRVLEQLLAKAEAAGLGAEDLDETVHDLANNIAADINNAGLEDQLRYLFNEWGGEAAAREIDRLAEERSANRNHQVACKHGRESRGADAAL